MADDYYLSDYNSLNITGDVSNIFAKLMHRFLESGRDSTVYEKVLEVGALNGEHTHFVRHRFSEYHVTDIRTPSQFNLAQLKKRGFLFHLANVESLPFEDDFFNRVVSTCLLHHLENPETGINEMLRVVKSGGTVDILVPHDPSFIYSLSWLATTGMKAMAKKKYRESRLNRNSEHIQEFKLICDILQKYTQVHVVEKKKFPPFFKFEKLTVLFRFTITKY
jgi:ubiquinone/menaquinone biosynthesis C-methylase UbiE